MKYKRNTIPEIEALSAMLRSRSVAKRKAAVEGLCAALEPMIRSLVPKYEQPVQGSEQDELIQVARVGLLEACQSHDRTKGAFLTHAMWCIRHALSHYVGGLSNPVRLTTVQSFRLPKLRRARQQLIQELHREPTVDELNDCKELRSMKRRLSKEDILTMLMYDEGPVPFDRTYADNSTRLGLNNRKESWVEHFPSDVPSPEAMMIAHEEAAQRRVKEQA